METRTRELGTPLIVGGALLVLFLALPWLMMVCRGLGMPGWTYGAEPMLGWMRVWALAPAWLLLGAAIALIIAASKRRNVA